MRHDLDLKKYKIQTSMRLIEASKLCLHQLGKGLEKQKLENFEADDQRKQSLSVPVRCRWRLTISKTTGASKGD